MSGHFDYALYNKKKKKKTKKKSYHSLPLAMEIQSLAMGHHG
jgi:hypothetical protein